MKKQLLGMGLATVLIMAASPSFATGKHHFPVISLKDKICQLAPVLCKKKEHPGNSNQPGPTPEPHVVPEINAANAGLAFALISGLVAIRRERRKHV
jgi:hypothetical protein